MGPRERWLQGRYTPLQSIDSEGCPGFPHTDQCTPSGNGVMYVNYMDYSDDVCMTMFSEGQKARMLAALNGPRASLLDSEICTPSTAVTVLEISSFDIFPNPASNELNIVLNKNHLQTI